MATKSEIMKLVRDEDVKFIRLQFTDMLGHMKNTAITDSKLEDALNNEFVCDGSAVEGFVSIEDSDIRLCPDLNTFAIFPWRPHQGKVARLICDAKTPSGGDIACDPRMVLKRVIKEAADMGYIFEVGPECEFFLMNTGEDGEPTAEPHDRAGYFDIAPADNGENCRRDICLTLEEMGYKIESSHHESACGQHEIVFKHGGVLTTADRLATFKSVVKTIAAKHGLHATFMPKPFPNEPGSGMHLTMSLFDKDGNNAFYSGGEARLSDTGYKFIAGLLNFIPHMACITNPTVNSYKRFIPGYDAPCFISWSENNRSLLVRVPHSAKPVNTRIELRLPDMTANPYLALAACLKAGLEGIKGSYELPAGIDINLYDLSRSEREKLGVKNLPISLNEALNIAKGSDFVTELLGEELKRRYIDAKRGEYDEYRRSISQWEINKYLTC